VLVNNAAIVQEKPFDELDADDWDRMQAVNLRGPFLCVRQVLPGMRAAGWGRIVNVSSIGGQRGGVRQVPEVGLLQAERVADQTCLERLEVGGLTDQPVRRVALLLFGEVRPRFPQPFVTGSLALLLGLGYRR